jgi:hypothetical protein
MLCSIIHNLIDKTRLEESLWDGAWVGCHMHGRTCTHRERRHLLRIYYSLEFDQESASFVPYHLQMKLTHLDRQLEASRKQCLRMYRSI